MKKVICFIANIFMGYIGFWWFLMGIVMAWNVDGGLDTAFLKPIGYVFLMALIGGVIGIEALLMKGRGIKSIIGTQIVPFAMGILIAVVPRL